MAEMRRYNPDDVYCSHTEIPNNWYVPARDMWKFCAHLMLYMRKGTVIRNDKDLNRFVGKIEDWIEDHAMAVGEER